MSVQDLFNALHSAEVLTDEDHRVLSSALSTRGKYRGNLRSSAPKDPAARGAWRALMINCAPARVGVGALMMASDEEREAFEHYEELLSVALLGRERIVLGVLMPLRFNTVSHHYELKSVSGLIDTIVRIHGRQDYQQLRELAERGNK